jgi:hypothetical protein
MILSFLMVWKFLIALVRQTAALGGIGSILVGLLSQAQAASSVTLTWNPGGAYGIAGYRVYYGTAEQGYSKTTDVGNATTTTISNLIPGRAYIFVATDYNSIGLESPPSNQVSFTATTHGTSVIASGDFNGDGKDDILWRNADNGDTWIWLMDGTAVAAAARVAIVDSSWKIVGIGDFDRQGKRDILWYNASIARIAIWTMNGFIETGSYEIESPQGGPDEWDVVGIADFDQTGLSDILWEDTYTGALYMWKCVAPMTFVAIGLCTVDPSWRVVGAADFEGNGLPDIIWHNSVTGGVYIWQLRNDQVFQEVSLGEYSLDWQIVGFGDFNGDRKQDILWRNYSTGDVVVWLMNGISIASQWYAGAPSLDWKIVGTPDLRGIGTNDILWVNSSAGLVTGWLGTPTYLVQPAPFASIGPGWLVTPAPQ